MTKIFNIGISSIGQLRSNILFLLSIDPTIKRSAIILLCLNIVNSFLEFSSVILFYILLSEVSNAEFDLPFDVSESVSLFLSAPQYIGPIIILCISCSASLKVYTINFHNNLSAFIGSKLASKCAQILIDIPLESVNSYQASNLLNLMSTDIPSVQAFYGTFFTAVLSSFVLLPILISLLIVEPLLTFAAFILILVLYIVSHNLTKNQQYNDGKTFTTSSRESLHQLRILMDNIKVFKTSSNQQYEINSFERKYSKARYAASSVTTRYSLPRYLIELFLYLLILLSINFIFVFNIGSARSSISALATLFFGLARVLGPSQILFAFYSQVNSISVVLEKIKSSIVLIDVDNSLITNHPTPIIQFSSLKFIDVSLRYGDNENFYLQGLNFTLRKSQSLGIAGASGSGKSTSVNIAAGLIKPQLGSVFLNDQDLYDDAQLTSFWSRSISYIPHNFSITGRTLFDIFAFGHSPINEDTETLHDVYKALSAAQYWNLPQSFYSSITHFRELLHEPLPSDLSSGQIQRLNIARGLFKRASLYIFDEFTSNLDYLTEERILSSIYSSMHSATKIFITHRLNQLRMCDHILLFGQGRIIDRGRYADLLKNSELFNEMVRNSFNQQD